MYRGPHAVVESAGGTYETFPPVWRKDPVNRIRGKVIIKERTPTLADIAVSFDTISVSFLDQGSFKTLSPVIVC
jgi:hypothetical protein